MTSQGSAYSRFQRALGTGNLQLIEAAAAELTKVSLEDALAILIVLAQRGDPRFKRAAARWVGRLLTETPANLTRASRWRWLSAYRAAATRCTGSLASGEIIAGRACDNAVYVELECAGLVVGGGGTMLMSCQIGLTCSGRVQRDGHGWADLSGAASPPWVRSAARGVAARPARRRPPRRSA